MVGLVGGLFIALVLLGLYYPGSGADQVHWRLRVWVDAGKAFRRLPAESVVVLSTNESPPRRFRLPVTGEGYQR